MANRYRTVFFSLFGSILVTGFLFSLYLSFAHTIVHNADNASVLLEAESMLHGNVLLHGWQLPPDNFITLDIPLYTVFEAFVGLNPLLMTVVPSIIFTVVILMSRVE